MYTFNKNNLFCPFVNKYMVEVCISLSKLLEIVTELSAYFSCMKFLGSRNCQDKLKIIFNSLADIIWEDGSLIFLDVQSSSFRNQLNQHFTARTSYPQLDIGFLLINFYLYEVVTFSFVFDDWYF